MNNPMQLISMLKGKTSPKEICMSMISNNANPMVKNLVEMAQKGQVDELKQFGRNLFSQQGKDFDKEYTEFMKNFK